MEPNTPIVPDLVRDTPVVAPTPEPVKFSPEQQAKLEEIIKDVTGRTARDVRAELAREKAEKEKIAAELRTALLAASPDATEADKLRLQLEQERKSKEELTASYSKERTNNAVLAAATTAGMINPQLAIRLIDVPPATADGTPDVAAITAAVQKLASENPNLVRGEVRPGSGSGPASSFPSPTLPVEKYFGRGSDAAAANRLAIKNPAAYKSLRAEAVRKGLI